ncbi:HzsA-related protein [Ketobacter sp.]|nr:MAG: hypothetical protein D6160_11725 [Ketobacter sp.]
MKIYSLSAGKTKQARLKTKAVLAFVLSLMLATLYGCGSDERLPGSETAGESDPLAAGTPMFYVQRLISEETDQLNDPLRFVGSARLMMKERASQNAKETNLSGRVYSGNYDVRDLDVSSDGQFVLFSMRAPQLENADEEEQPTWNIWEYDVENDALRRVIPDDITAERGHDITPRYLPTGDIVFASTRQQKTRAVLLDEGKPAFANREESGRQAALSLHVMEEDGSSIRQITFNMSHDFYPVVTLDGRIVYSRWDRYARNAVSLYRTNADGTGNELLYGLHSHDSGHNDSDLHFVKADILPDGSLYVLARPMNSTSNGGDFITIDVDSYIDNYTPTATTNGNGPAQTSITDHVVETDNPLSPGGYYSAYFALWDDTSRALTSWNQCRVHLDSKTLPCLADNLDDPAATAPAPMYNVWMVDYDNKTQVPVLKGEPGFYFSDLAMAAPKEVPQPYYDDDSLTGVTDGKISAATYIELKDAQNEEAVIHIRNVYETDGWVHASYPNWSNPSVSNAEDRPARFLRVIKGAYEPPRNVKQPANGSFGLSNTQRMKEIIGYAPIEPDGSVKVRVPANVPLMISVTDKDGKRLNGRHQNWISLRPGEVLECKGCHSRNSTAPHGRYDAQADSTNQGLPAGSSYPGADPAITAPFDYATMAEAKAAATMDRPEDSMILNPDLIYVDTWRAGSTPDASLMLQYSDMLSSADTSFYTAPANTNCSPWNARCRITIHYQEHIQPLWEYPRDNLASDGNPATCIRCHNRTTGSGNPRIPSANLELTGEVDGTNGVRNRAYIDLFFADVEMVADGSGGVTDCTQEEPRLDENGDPVLDDMNNPITDTVLCPPTLAPVMSSAGAMSSPGFFDKFEAGASHDGYMTPGELRLIAEWLDIGGQYYNNHFDAPDN